VIHPAAPACQSWPRGAGRPIGLPSPDIGNTEAIAPYRMEGPMLALANSASQAIEGILSASLSLTAP
jgi:hypothetical protein